MPEFCDCSFLDTLPVFVSAQFCNGENFGIRMLNGIKTNTLLLLYPFMLINIMVMNCNCYSIASECIWNSRWCYSCCSSYLADLSFLPSSCSCYLCLCSLCCWFVIITITCKKEGFSSPVLLWWWLTCVTGVGNPLPTVHRIDVSLHKIEQYRKEKQKPYSTTRNNYCLLEEHSFYQHCYFLPWCANIWWFDCVFCLGLVDFIKRTCGRTMKDIFWNGWMWWQNRI